MLEDFNGALAGFWVAFESGCNLEVSRDVTGVHLSIVACVSWCSALAW